MSCRAYRDGRGIQMSMTRDPAVAGKFYEANPALLSREIEIMTGGRHGTERATAVIAPHAGYIYSGAVAARAYARIAVPETVVIMGPNHTGLGAPAAVMDSGLWRMPLGNVPIASDIADQLIATSKFLRADYQAHLYEHSLEVQVPFLQYFQPDLEIVPVCLGHIPFEACQEIGNVLATVIQNAGRPVLMVASTDMTHYEPQERANALDRLAIEKILAMDAAGLYTTVVANNISMCGFIPTAATLVASSALGATGADLVQYATSGDVSGDYSQVVGYASFIIS